MSKREKHNDPTKKKKKKSKKSEEELPARREIVEPDTRKLKILRRNPPSDVLPSVSTFLEEKSTTQQAKLGSVEEKRSKILRFLIPPSQRRSTPSSSEETSHVEESNVSVRVNKAILRTKSSLLGKYLSHDSLAPPSSQSSGSLNEVENEVISPTITPKATLQEFPTSSLTDRNDSDLVTATYMRDLERVKIAIERGANINVLKDGLTPLLIATECADLRLINYFLNRKNVDINRQDDHGQTSLMIAIRNGLDEIAEELIYREANVNVRDNLGRTALHMALFHKKNQLAKLLLSYGANYEISDCFGERPMYTCAVRRPNLEGLNILLEVGAAPDYAHVTGINLLSRAIFNHTSYEIIEKLITNGANVNFKDAYSGKAPLHFAAAINNLKVVKLLLQYGANPNIETNYGYTPYDQAIFHGSLDVAQFLASITTNDVKWSLLKDLKSRRANA